MKRLTLLLLVAVSIISCGKKANNSNVKLLLGNLVSTGTIAQNGGVYLVGHRLDDFQSIAVGLKLDGSDNLFTLEKGKWEFAAIGWSGAPGSVGGLTGETRCAYSGVKDLALDNEQIELNLSKTGCDFSLPGTGERFSAAADLEADKMFKRVNFYSCMEIQATPLSGSECFGLNNSSSTSNVGLTKSYEIVLPGEFETGGQRSPLPGLKSSCINLVDGDALRLPTGNGVDSFIHLALVAYPEENCRGNPNVLDFKDSLRVNSTQVNRKSYFSANDPYVSSEIAVYFEHNPNSAVSAQIFGNGQDGNTLSALTVSDYANVSSINGNTISVTSGHGTSINPYDEVMIYISKDNGDCGLGFGQGRFTFNRVASKGTDSFTFFKSVSESFGGSLPNIGDIDCDIQIAKVYNLQNLTLLGTTLPALPFDEVGKIGGILALRVKGSLSFGFDGMYGSSVSASGAGFSTTTSGQVPCSSSLSQCAPFGHGYFDGTAYIPGGGAVYVSARSIITDANTANHYIKSVESAAGAGKGSVLIRMKDANLANDAYVNAEGEPANINVRYCSDANTTLANYFTVNGVVGIANLIQTSSLCY